MKKQIYNNNSVQLNKNHKHEFIKKVTIKDNIEELILIDGIIGIDKYESRVFTSLPYSKKEVYAFCDNEARETIFSIDSILEDQVELYIYIHRDMQKYKDELKAFIHYIYQQYPNIQNLKIIKREVLENTLSEQLDENDLNLIQNIECFTVDKNNLAFIKEEIKNQMKRDIDDTKSKIEELKNQLKFKEERLEKYLNQISNQQSVQPSEIDKEKPNNELNTVNIEYSKKINI
jgi:hypothetical protein